MWEFVGPQTVVVGHSVRNDLAALRWIHEKCVDSLLVEEGWRREMKAKEQAEREAMELNYELNRRALNKIGRDFLGNPIPEEEEKFRREWVVKVEERRKEIAEKERQEKTRPEDGMSLKALAKKKLGRTIQDGGNKGHDSVEDAVAARDLIHYHVVGMIQKDRQEREEQVRKDREEQARKEAEENARRAANGAGGPGTAWEAPPMNYSLSHFPAAPGWGR